MDALNSQVQPVTFAEFAQESQRGNVVAVARTFAPESLNPVDAFVRVAAQARYAFLFESVEGGEGVAKYSFLGADPYMIVRGRDNTTTIERAGKTETRAERVTDFLKRHFAENKLARRAELGPLAGGAVGYLGYQAAKWFEPALNKHTAAQSSAAAASDEQSADAFLMFYRTLVVFDRVAAQLKIISVVFTNEAGGNESRLKELYETAVRDTEQIEQSLSAAPSPLIKPDAREVGRQQESEAPANTTDDVRSNWTKADFQHAVAQVQEHIFAGDCYQVVLSQRFTRAVTADAVSIYRALRQSNPAPYTYLLKNGDESIIGASPEMLVRCRGRQLDYRPIAGTRPRGTSALEDELLAAEMLGDEKEVAEHMMLVDLGRNDLGRVAEFGSVKVEELMSVERYSKVQHLVSSLSARLREGEQEELQGGREDDELLGGRDDELLRGQTGKSVPLKSVLLRADRFDALAACFPAGTVTGAPKVRAMEIIRELEPDERGVYAGAVLYIDYADSLDSCIAIRTIVLNNGVAAVQAGAGIVADSVPEREYEETFHKARALLRAIEIAEGEE